MLLFKRVPIGLVALAVVGALGAALAAIDSGGFGLARMLASSPLAQTIPPGEAAVFARARNPTLALAEAGVTRNADWTPYTEKRNGVVMALVPNGCFEMGSDSGGSGEKPAHQVCFDKPYWIDVFEVTQGQFAEFGGQTAQGIAFTGDNRPRESITWGEAQDFCNKRQARLPTEAEWEYAARGPDDLAFPWGNTFVADDVIYSSNSTHKTWKVGSMPGGRSWVGAYDLSGNVWEWVSDWYGAYPSGRQVNPTGPASGTARVMRGGSWFDGDGFASATFRNWYVAASRSSYFGFRCGGAVSGVP